MNNPQIKLSGFTIDSKDPRALAEFYAELLGWIIPFEDETYVGVAPPSAKQGSYPGILIQRNPGYVPPVWPDEPGAQQQMAHLDFAVDDMTGAEEHAIACGATVASRQFDERWKVMLDPAGHPFCLCDGKILFDSPDFALL